MIVRLLELGVALVAGLFLVTQVIVPLIREESVFPFLRAKARLTADFIAMNKRLDDLESAKKQQAELEARIAALETEKKVTEESK